MRQPSNIIDLQVILPVFFALCLALGSSKHKCTRIYYDDSLTLTCENHDDEHRAQWWHNYTSDVEVEESFNDGDTKYDLRGKTLTISNVQEPVGSQLNFSCGSGNFQLSDTFTVHVLKKLKIKLSRNDSISHDGLYPVNVSALSEKEREQFTLRAQDLNSDSGLQVLKEICCGNWMLSSGNRPSICLSNSSGQCASDLGCKSINRSMNCDQLDEQGVALAHSGKYAQNLTINLTAVGELIVREESAAVNLSYIVHLRSSCTNTSTSKIMVNITFEDFPLILPTSASTIVSPSSAVVTPYPASVSISQYAATPNTSAPVFPTTDPTEGTDFTVQSDPESDFLLGGLLGTCGAILLTLVGVSVIGLTCMFLLKQARHPRDANPPRSAVSSRTFIDAQKWVDRSPENHLPTRRPRSFVSSIPSGCISEEGIPV